MRALVLTIIILFGASTARAQPPAATGSAADQLQLHEPGDLVPLRRGQAAPSDGLLIDAHDMLQIQQDYERMRFTLTLTQERDQQVCDVRVQIEQARTTAATDRLALHTTLWTDRQQELVQAVQAAQQQAQRAGQREWFESPPLWAAIGVVLATVVFVAVSVH